MSKIAGIKNKSPETYPGPRVKPTVVQTLSTNNPLDVTVNGTFATILNAPLSFTPEVPGVKAILMVSGVLQTPSPSGETTVAIVLDPSGGDDDPPRGRGRSEHQRIAHPVQPGLRDGVGVLTTGVPVTIDVQAKTTSGSGTVRRDGRQPRHHCQHGLRRRIMGKIAGLKGRSPETYPNARNLGVVSTQSHVNPDAVGPLTTGR